MTTQFTSQYLEELFTFPFQDEKWLSKFLIFVILILTSFLIIPGFILGGYFYEIMRRIIVDQQGPSLPDWENAGGYLQNGFKLFLVGFVYTLPGLVFMLLAFLSFSFLPLTMTETFPENEIFFFISFLGGMGLMLFGALVGLVMQFFSLVGIGHMIAHGETGAAFRIREWWPIFRNNLGGYALSYLLLIGASWIIGIVSQFLMMTLILCVLLPVLYPAVYAYLGLLGSAVFGQAYRDGAEASRTQEKQLT
jgi:hypothetical protein